MGNTTDQVDLAERLGSSERDEEALQELRDSDDIGDLRAEAGCNLLLVYLLKRWTGVFDGDGAARIAADETFHNEVIDAYIGAGCSVDERFDSHEMLFSAHTDGWFKRVEEFSSEELSAFGFVEELLEKLHPDMRPEAYQQLKRLKERLQGHLD